MSEKIKAMSDEALIAELKDQLLAYQSGEVPVGMRVGLRILVWHLRRASSEVERVSA